MTTFAPGDRVHLAGLGTGTVREVRSGGRYVIDIKGRAVVVAGSQLELASDAPARSVKPAGVDSSSQEPAGRAGTARSIDLHGKTVDDALDALEVFVNDALLDGSDEVRVIHGRGGGRIRAAVHRYLRKLPAIASARLDPHNPGVTIVTFS